jgi:hypothetical protein
MLESYCLPLFSLIGPDLYSRLINHTAFKNGRIATENSLLLRKINHPSWQSALFGSRYYVVVQLNQHSDQRQKKELMDRGIRLEQWISGNNWLATCRQGFNNRNLTELGIRNIYSLPSSLKINAQLLNM